MIMSKGMEGGQAFIEFLIVLPLLFFIIIFSLQIFSAVYDSQTKQLEARHQILTNPEVEEGRGIYYRANGGQDLTPVVVVERVSRPVRTPGLPIFSGTEEAPPISNKIGMCRELTGTCAP